jgi:nanoRNase/pAp phosphatase (c-di-AMP/oligoRNAs hydrolase)
MRLVTRSDFDGLVCAVLLEEAGIVDDYLFVHPKDVQDGKVDVGENDVMANVPYLPGCGLWFDHHSSEDERLTLAKLHFKGDSRPAPSCARVIYDYYGGPEKFSKLDETGLMAAVDKSDAAQFEREDILDPTGWVLLSFVMDARTGLGRFRDYRISNYQLMQDMIKYCRTMTAEEILKIEDVKERVDRYFKQEKDYEQMITDNAKTDGNVLVINLLREFQIFSGNRFKEYVLYPDANVSVRVLWGRGKENVVFTVGHSVMNRTCNTDVGSLMLKYGGGGHRPVGTCQVPIEDWEKSLDEIVATMKADD